MPTFGESPACPVCQQKVYFAEEVKCLNNSYHKLCLKCCGCSRTLDTSTVNDHNGSIYCRACYGKQFGPKGYGFASGGTGLQSDGQPDADRIRPSARRKLEPRLEYSHRYASTLVESATAASSGGGNGGGSCAPSASGKYGGGGDKCGRCSDTVYFNERVQASGRVFHRGCFKCRDCAKPLEAGGESEHKGEVYCRGCYTKGYGTKGFVAGSSMHAS